MAIRRKSSATYVADTGKEFEVGDMTDSHLLNVIVHHTNQIRALREVEGMVMPPHHLAVRRDLLTDTVRILTEELATRDPATEDERRAAYVEGSRQKWAGRSYE